MCMFSATTSKVKAPIIPPEYAAQRSPDEKSAVGAGKKLKDRMRAKAATLLTGNAGVGAPDAGGKKMLLGQ